jgi:hypothetical protein
MPKGKAMKKLSSLVSLTILVACSGSGPGPGGASLCESSCPKSCGSDSDCNVSNGEECCNYGSFGHACQQAAQCPVFCSSDSQCDTANGQKCCVATSASTQTICSAAAACVTPCSSDAQCDTASGAKCQTGIKQPYCTPIFETPCTSTSQCAAGAVCCTTLSLVDPNDFSSGNGLCLTSGLGGLIGFCPTACNTDTDCASNTSGTLCCNGMCASSCPSTCNSDSDCSAKSNGDLLCCGIDAIASPFWR